MTLQENSTQACAGASSHLPRAAHRGALVASGVTISIGAPLRPTLTIGGAPRPAKAGMWLSASAGRLRDPGNRRCRDRGAHAASLLRARTYRHQGADPALTRATAMKSCRSRAMPSRLRTNLNVAGRTPVISCRCRPPRFDRVASIANFNSWWLSLKAKLRP